MLEHTQLLAAISFAIVASVIGALIFSRLPARRLFAAASLAFLSGVFFLLLPRATEVSLPLLGHIKAEADQAMTYAAEIKVIRRSVTEDKNRIDAISQAAEVTAKRTAELSEQNTFAATRLSDFQKKVDGINSATNSLQAAVDFAETTISALSDGRRAYDQLVIWSNDQAFRFNDAAGQIAASIEGNLQTSLSFGEALNWSPGVQPEKLGISDFQQAYKWDAWKNTSVRVALIQYVATRQDISKACRVRFFVNAFQTDDSLRAVVAAGRSLNAMGITQLRALPTKYISEWWDEHSAEFSECAANP